MKGKFRYSIDAIGYGRALGLTGWAAHETAEIRSLSLRTSARHRISCRHGLSRPDVAAALPHYPASADSGFVVTGVRAEGMVALVAELADGREIVEPLCRIDGADLSVLTRRFSGTLIQGNRREDPDFSHMSALLRVHRHTPLPAGEQQEPVLVIVPVYGGLDYLRPFFRSLLDHSGETCRIVVVDDGNRNPEVLAIMGEAGSDSRVTVIRKTMNGGFVEACREGFRSWRGEHVVVANTDIVLPEGWLARLVAPLERDRRVASTTPFSNCATICGFPFMPDDNPLFLGLDPALIDGAFRHLDGAAIPLHLPTGVGFCMGMSRHALAQIGFFEADTFGRGYGEENDWCRKAIMAGFVHLLAPDLFIYHAHGGSFPSDQKRQLISRNLAILRQRYPDYESEVAELTLLDPWQALRGFIAFILASQAHPRGAEIRLAAEGEGGAGGAPDRPFALIEFSRTNLCWRYTLSWSGGEMALDGGNFTELDEFFARIKIGTLTAGDLSGCRVRPSAERLTALGERSLADHG